MVVVGGGDGEGVRPRTICEDQAKSSEKQGKTKKKSGEKRRKPLPFSSDLNMACMMNEKEMFSFT